MVSIDPCKPLNRKRKPTASKLDASNNELVAKKVDNRFLFDVTTQEIESFMEGECPSNTTKSNEWAV